MQILDIILAAVGGILGVLAGMYLLRQEKFDERKLKAKADKILENAQQQSKTIVETVRAKVVERKKQFEIEQQEFVAQLDRMEKILTAKIAMHQKRELKNEEVKRAMQEEEKTVFSVRNQAENIDKEIIKKLCGLTGLLPDRAKQELVVHYENEFKADAEGRLQRQVEWAEESSARDSKSILTEIMHRFSGITSVEHEQPHIKVPRDEIKGRVVGRGGKMVAFFENLFGVDVVFNDEPNLIIVSSFNLVQQEIARLAMERLMREKTINEEVITKIKSLAEQDMDKILRKEGEAALKILGIYPAPTGLRSEHSGCGVNNMPPDFAKLIGRLKFRTSYGQNIMRHCFEVGYFARLLADAIGANSQIAWVGGFFHDIGKAVDQEVGGSHDVLSKEILEKYGFSKEIVHAAWTHHNSAPIETTEALMVQAADAISASRPGARAESLERYLAKIKDLEETALSFAGTKKAYAINAGREVRVIVDSDQVNDKGVENLASEIAAKVQEKGGYPGKVKVTTIRTTKVTDYAK